MFCVWKPEMESSSVCRFCLATRRNFKKIEKSDYDTLNMLLPALDLTLTKDPVVCQLCSKLMQKYLTFKTVSLDIKNTQNIKDICSFCTNSITSDSSICLNSQDMEVSLLRTMMQQYFPELIHTDLLNICSVCHKIVQSIIDFFVNWQRVEQYIAKYCQTVGVFIKREIDLENVVQYANRETAGSAEISCASSNKNLEADRYIKEEPNEEFARYIKVENENLVSDPVDYKLTDIVNESETFVDKTVKLEYEFTGTEGTNINVNENLKIEPIWIKQETIDIKSIKEEKLPENNKLERFVEKRQSRAEIRAKKMHRRLWWTNTSVIRNSDSPTLQYFSRTELRAMISRIHMSGKKYQCQVCQFITSDKCSVNRHMRLHQDPSELETLECHNCGYKTKSKSNLKSHMMTHRDRSQMPVYQCEYCPFSTKSKNNLRWHLVKHDAATDVTMFECYTCGFKACRKITLIGHMSKHRRKGSEPEAHQCEYCGFETKHSSTFSKHLESHREPVKCIHCEFETKYNATIKRHLRKVHNIEVGRRKIDLVNALMKPVVVE